MMKYFEKINIALDVLILVTYFLIKDACKWSVVLLIQTGALILSLLGLMSDGVHEHNKRSKILLQFLNGKMKGDSYEFNEED